MTRTAVARMLLVAALVAAAPCSAAAHEGWGVMVDPQGRVYVTDIPANTIWRISPDGRVEPIGRHIHSHALSSGPDGAVCGTHASLTEPVRSVWCLDGSGRFTDVIPATRGFPLGLQSFLRAPDGSVYSANPYQYPEPEGGREIHLLRWSPDGAVDTIAGGVVGHADGTGRAARFHGIDGMAWLPDGAIVLADGARLRRVSTDGRVESLGDPITESRWDQDLLGVAVGPDGAVYGADFAGRVVRRVAGGRVESLYRPGGFWSPTGLAVTTEGVYVLEHPRAPFGILGDLGVGPYLRVRRLGPDGQSVTLTTRWGRFSEELAGTAVLLAGGLISMLWLRRRV